MGFTHNVSPSSAREFIEIIGATCMLLSRNIKRFSARVLERTCSALDSRRVAALLVCGGGSAAAAMVSSASRAGVPVLRASPSHLHLSYTIANELLPLEIRLEITARETLHALRATLLHTHWHTFTLLAEEDIYTTLSLRKDLSSILTTQPLNPKWLSLPTKYTRRALFRRLAEVSRLTRGVIVLICDIHYTKHVMDEAKRLNMLEGHFFWLWIDASSEFDVFHSIGNRTRFAEVNDHDFNSFRDKDNAVKYDIDDFDRRKRDDADNNVIEKRKLETTRKLFQFMNKNATKENSTSLKNSSRNSIFRNNNRNISKFETHMTNKLLLYVNFSRLSNSSENISEENVRNYNVNNKGVETSKVENNSIEKESKSSLYRNNSRRTSSSKLKNESFNKYVNSISEHELYESKDMLMEESILSSIDNEDLRDNLLFSSDISDFIMNPTVHTPTVNKIRDKIEDRLDRLMMKQDDEPISDVKSNASTIFNSLPIGLLALYPQPMKIDDTFARAATRMMVGALRRVLRACDAWSAQAQFFSDAAASCWDEPSDAASDFSMEFVRMGPIIQYNYFQNEKRII